MKQLNVGDEDNDAALVLLALKKKHVLQLMLSQQANLDIARHCSFQQSTRMCTLSSSSLWGEMSL